jgi:hypothetical protein
VFGWFGRKKIGSADANAKLQWAQDTAYAVVMTQVDLAGAADDGPGHDRLATAYAFGYIFGFADALIQRAGAKDDVEIMAQLTLVFTRLFGVDKGSKIFGASLRRQTDPQFGAGRSAGGSEAVDWLSSGGKNAPTRLTFYLSDSSSPGGG